VGIIREFPTRGVTFERLHVQATRGLTETARTAGVKRYLHMSALGARHDGVSRYHRSKWQAEEIVRASGLCWTIFRPSIIFGPKDGFINLLAGYIRNFPAVPVIGDGSYCLQPIAADDVAGCFAKSLSMPEAECREFELCGPDRLTYCELLDLIAELIGKKQVVKIHNPVGLMKLVVPLLQRFPFFPITMDQIQMLLEGSVCDGAWQKEFGWEPIRLRSGIGTYLNAGNL
jgi:NADH dehydrogenase